MSELSWECMDGLGFVKLLIKFENSVVICKKVKIDEYINLKVL